MNFIRNPGPLNLLYDKFTIIQSLGVKLKSPLKRFLAERSRPTPETERSKSVSSGSSLSSGRNKCRPTKYRQRKSTLQNKRRPEDQHSSSSEDLEQSCQYVGQARSRSPHGNKRKKVSKRALSNYSQDFDSFSNSSSKNNRLNRNSKNSSTNNSANLGGPKESEWNNFDETIKRIRSNLSTGNEMGYDQFNGDEATTITAKKYQNQKFSQNCQGLNHVGTSNVITNVDVHEIADENSLYNIKEDGPNNIKLIHGNTSEDNSGKELVLRMSEDDVEEDFTNLKKNDTRIVDNTNETGSEGK